MSSLVFNPAARDALDLARAEAAKRHHPYIGTEHILLGLLASKAQSMEAMVRRLGLDRAAIASSLDAVIKRGKDEVPAAIDLPFTSRAKRVLELALAAAASMQATDVGPEHLFVGVCDEERGIAAHVLIDSGIGAAEARSAIKPPS